MSKFATEDDVTAALFEFSKVLGENEHLLTEEMKDWKDRDWLVFAVHFLQANFDDAIEGLAEG